MKRLIFEINILKLKIRKLKQFWDMYLKWCGVLDAKALELWEQKETRQ